MAFVLGSSSFYPCLCGVFTCSCGRRARAYGRLAAVLPAGWIERRRPDGEPEHVCETCRAAASRPTGAAGRA